MSLTVVLVKHQERLKSWVVGGGLILFSILPPAFLQAAQTKEQNCLDCHPPASIKFTGMAGQIGDINHHVQGAPLSSKHCYACHWEARADGNVDHRYHQGEKPTISSAGDPKVHLVVWAAGKRPDVYKLYSSAITYQSSAMGSPDERNEVAKISRHCLGCHSDDNNNTATFPGDPRTPRHYAWDGQSIASRYSQRGVTTWGKYSTAKGNGKMKVVKAFSAHGNAASNQGGWSPEIGYDGAIPVTRGGPTAKNVDCFDCHNSHGSRVSGITSSYRTFDGGYNGGLLKETEAGKGGYTRTYLPSANLDQKSANPYNVGAGLCFDCHESAKADSAPWGYTTFGATQPILGYKDTHRFGPGIKGSTARFAGRQTRTSIAGGHLKAGKFLNYSTHGEIRGLCTSCHDPHGVSPSLGDAMAYAIPLLKGSWLTSPYREDAPPALLPTKGSYQSKAANMSISWEKGDLKGQPSSDSFASATFNTDRNTFGEGKRISETLEQFAGLCLRCHKQEAFTGNKNDRMHRAVKGWGENREHSFPCSKCHQVHNSGLPRLMQTNCLESGPAGLRDSVAAPWFAGKDKTVATASKKGGKEAVVGCHIRRAGQGNSQRGQNNNQRQWKSATPW